MKTKSLIAVVGPTAIGKTTLAIALAKHYKTQILSADSRQFYKEMRIGTAVPDSAELKAAPHHFIQHLSIHDSYSVGDYERDALRLLEQLFKIHNTIILVGGSGLYVDAVTKGLDNFPKVSPEIRLELKEQLNSKGIAFLQNELERLDPDYFKQVDRFNPQRLIRALEICIGTGKPFSAFLENNPTNRPFETTYVALTAERDLIYNRIEKRVDLMMAEGLLEEARKLYTYRELNSLQTVGYKELFSHFDGKISLSEAVGEIKKNTRRFAKRQLTWYRRDPKILWFSHDTEPAMILEKLEERAL